MNFLYYIFFLFSMIIRIREIHLKYGFCKKSLQKNETLTSCPFFSFFFITFGWVLLATGQRSWTLAKLLWPSWFHHSSITFCRFRTLLGHNDSLNRGISYRLFQFRRHTTCIPPHLQCLQEVWGSSAETMAKCSFLLPRQGEGTRIYSR